MLDHMKQILVQLDDALAEELERFVPGSSRKRSDFIRKAIARALLDVVEVTTSAAYARHPPRYDANGWAHPDEAYPVPRALRSPRAKRRPGSLKPPSSPRVKR